MKRSVFVSVPATSGNIGPGFDVLGLALGLRNELRVRVLSKRAGTPKINIQGEGAGQLPLNAKNVVYKAIQFVFKKAKKKLPALELTCLNSIPLARGLGSSAAAVLSGLLAGNKLLGNPFSKDQLVTWATLFEGHPDNVVPALYGGARAAAWINKRVLTAELPVPTCGVVVAIPEFKLSTKKARAVLPKKVSLQQAVQNLQAVALLPTAFASKKDWLKDLLNDRLHEPYRAKLIPGFNDVKKAALKSGALGVTLSGAGPTVLSFVEEKTVSRVSLAMGRAFLKRRVRCRLVRFGIDTQGARVK